MNLLLLAAILISAICIVSGGYPLSSSDRLALRGYLRDVLLDNDIDAPQYIRHESAANNKLNVPPNTFVSGGTGEGQQHIGATGKIPNKQVAIPEVHASYSTPPNPCPKTIDESAKESAQSVVRPELTCYCDTDWKEAEEDCTASDKCCLEKMANTAAFVSQYQEEGEQAEQGNLMTFKRNQFTEGDQIEQLVAKKSPEVITKRSLSKRRINSKRYNPYLDNQPFIDSVVAKKSPGLSGFPAM